MSNLVEVPLRLSLVSGPSVEPISRTEAESHLRLVSNEEAGTLTRLIQVGREWLETGTRRALISQQWDLFLDQFPASAQAIELPKPPLISVDSITYIDADGATQTFAAADYEVDTATEPGRVRPVPDKVWPIAQDDRLNAVTVRFTAGYGTDADDVPAGIRQGLLLVVEHLFENRGATAPALIREVPMGLKHLIQQYRWGDYPL